MPRNLKKALRGGGLAVVELDGAGDQSPVGLGQPAVGHRAVDDAVVALAGLEQHPAGKQQRVGGGVDDGVAGGAHALRAVDVVEAGGVHVQAHVAVVGVDEHIVGPAGNLQWPSASSSVVDWW